MLCRRTGQPIDICFCEDCILADSDKPAPWSEPKIVNIRPEQLEKLVEYIESSIIQITETVGKASEEMGFQVSKGGNRGGGSGKKNAGLPYLQPDDLSVDKKRCVILWAGDPRDASVFADWAKITVKVEAIDSKVKRLWTLGDTNPCFDDLVDALGEDAENWKGREIFLWIEIDDVTEKKYIRVEVIAQDAASRKKGAASTS